MHITDPPDPYLLMTIFCFAKHDFLEKTLKPENLVLHHAAYL